MRRSQRFKRVGALAVFAAMIGLVACSPQNSSSPSRSTADDGVLRIGSTTEVVNWTPLNSVSITDIWVMDQMYPALLLPTKDGSYEPELAKSVESAPDGASVTVRLDPEFKWSDGRPITASDVQFTLERLRDNKLISAGAYIGNFDSATVQDEHTALVHLKTPSYSWGIDLGQSLRVLPKHIFEKAPNMQDLSIENTPEYWVSGGAITLEKVEPGQRYRFIPNPNYPHRTKENSAITAVEFQIYSDINTMQLALRNNDIDLMAPVVPASALGELKQQPNIKIASAELSNNLTKLTFNTSHESLQNPAVRRALAGLIDPEAIVKNVLLGQADLLVGPLVKAHAEFQPDISIHKNSPEDAKAVLAQAGLENLQLSLLCDQGNANQVKSAQLVKEMLAKADVTVDIKCTERTTALATAKTGDFDLFIHKLNIPRSAGTELFQQFDPSNPSSLNYSFNTDQKMSDLFTHARTVVTHQDYVAAVAAAAAHIHEQAYIVALFSERLNSAYNDSRFEGYRPASLEMTTMLAANSLAGLTPTEK